MIAVIGIGAFYTFISWGVIVGNGPDKAVDLASSSDPFQLLYSPAREYLGEWGVTAFEWLVLGGSFACALAIHNSAARYLFAFGRDGLLWRRLGGAHHRHASPWVASLTQSVFAAVLLIICAVSDSDPYAVLFVLVAILATLCLLIVQTMSSISTIVYFHVKKEHPETAHWWRTLVAPAVGGLGMVYVIYLMASNMTAAAGSASDTLFFKMIPWIVGLLFLGSMTVAAVWRKTNPRRYARIGSTVFDDRPDELLAADRA
jgi:amino acid transporter